MQCSDTDSATRVSARKVLFAKEKDLYILIKINFEDNSMTLFTLNIL